MKIKLYSHYHHFQKHEPKEGEDYINCYNDIFITKREQIREDDIALLVEPRFIQPEVYTYVEQHYDTFRYVFTHDSWLLMNIPNAKLIIWGGVWGWYDGPKIKKVSMVTSDKANNYWRKERINLARILKRSGLADVYGTFDGGPRVDTKTVYADYRFNVAMENCIDDFWMTEKLCNCFSHRTVPIYIGAPAVIRFFNKRGMIFANSINEVIDILRDPGIESFYSDKDVQEGIEANYKLVKKYAVFEDWFFEHYGDDWRGWK